MNKPLDPRSRVEGLMRTKEWTQSDLAKHMNVTPSAISMILSGKRHLTTPMLLRLARLTAQPIEDWLKLNEDYLSWLKTDEARQQIAEESAQINGTEVNGLAPGLMVDWQIKNGLREKLLSIDPYSDESLQVASYDLSVGTIVMKGARHAESELGKEVSLPPGGLACIESQELVQLSNRILGRVGIPTTLSTDYIFISVGLQIDPGYAGSLIASVRNDGDEPCVFKIGETKIFSIEFHALAMKPERKFYDIRPEVPMSIRPGKQTPAGLSN